MGESSIDGDLQGGVQLMFTDIQTKEFQCPICAKYFSRKFTLDAHMLIHKGEKPHMCQFCGKSFRQKGTLMRHKALHSSKNLFHCSLCNRGFRQKNVFIHHLRHRHNVSTETLDRRKYRTEPKDYQSIMDTLPPFVHADSTAIASSGKHFDALLSKSIQKTAVDPLESPQYNCVGENTINSTINAVNTSDHLSINVNEAAELNSLTPYESELVIDEDCLEDVKPIFPNNPSEINPSVPSNDGIITDIPHTTNSTIVVACSQLNSVTSSNDVNEESIICIPCHRSFSNESEFKCHMKTHVQSVLLGDMNSGELASNINHISSASTISHNNSSAVVSNSKDSSCQNQKDNLNSLSPHHNPVKAENSDSEMENHLPSERTNAELPKLLSPYSKNELPKNNDFFCPVCKLYFQTQATFRKHAKSHDPYTLLKLYREALAAKNVQCLDKKPISGINSKSSSIENHNDNLNKSSLKNFQNVECSSKSNMMKSSKNKCPKKFHCMRCKKVFCNKTLYQYHLQLHLNSKGFQCGCCKKSFSTKTMLLSHTRSNHFKVFSCLKCSRIFNYRKLFDLHRKRCICNFDLKTSNGNQINFPIVSIESLLNSDVDGIVGIIPVCNTGKANGITNVKVGIPVMSVSQIKALYQSSSNSSKS